MLETARSIKDKNIYLYYYKILLCFTDLSERILSPWNNYAKFGGFNPK